ncbi:MAG: bifunctional SDR family oxidoreductase/aminotransferase class I/II-fold pyridoxal phosphate-dependent enzyme [Candidatus Hydrogenedens sp.]|nr:bifunctional SDR family oxidoreductase/aminotransferase class I/II-fold pyridoxal phosphate-dependent enzyme [Candidatus Hydrogenedens sp.]
MHVLITGGVGYLGSWVTYELLKKGHKVRIYDRLCFGKPEKAEWLSHPNVELIEGDIRYWQKYPDLFNSIDVVIHLAGLANDPSCALCPITAKEVNTASTVELARQSSQKGVKKFIFASTCAVYGKGVGDWLDEESPTNPWSMFAQTKNESEKIVLSLGHNQFSPVIARLSTLFGYSPRMRFDLALNLMTAMAKTQGTIEVHGGGQQWRPFLHVRDCARAICILTEAEQSMVHNEIFNIGANELNKRILDLANEVASLIPDTKVEILKEDEDWRTFRVLFNKFASRFSFQPEYKIYDGVQEILNWFHQNPSEEPFSEKYINVFRFKQLKTIPVSEGGEPTAPRFIPLAKPILGKEEETAILQAIRSGWLTSGDKINAFERIFASTVGAKEAVAVSSCTSAIHLCLVEAGVKAGDEVITPPITWVSTINTILNMGAKPVFVDVDPITFNINPELIEEKITKKTKVIIPVDLAGHPCELEAIQNIAERYNLHLIEDSAHALGATYHSKPIGSISERTCFSFYATKNITTIEGGMITLSDPEKARMLRILATNGLTDTAWDRYGRSAFYRPQELVSAGFKYAMSNVSASIGVEQIKKLSTFNSVRQRLVQRYYYSLSDIDEIILPKTKEHVQHAWHLFIIRLDTKKIGKSRDEIAFMLRQENIGTGIHFYGVHLHPYIQQQCNVSPESCPVATQISNEILSLPLHPELTEENIQYIVDALKKVIYYAKH